MPARWQQSFKAGLPQLQSTTFSAGSTGCNESAPFFPTVARAAAGEGAPSEQIQGFYPLYRLIGDTVMRLCVPLECVIVDGSAQALSFPFGPVHDGAGSLGRRNQQALSACRKLPIARLRALPPILRASPFQILLTGVLTDSTSCRS